jgi:chaperonin GroEL
MRTVGINGLITVESSSNLDTSINITTGMKLDRGWASPLYINSPEDGKCVLENPYILVSGERISSMPQIIPILQQYQQQGEGRPLLIVCDDIDDNVSSVLITNVIRGAIRCCVVKGLDFGDARKNIMEDIATVVGATHVCSENSVKLIEIDMSSLGEANKVVVSRDSCVIYEGKGNPEEINNRALIVKARLDDPDTTDYDKTKFEKRLANLTGGVAVIKAGGATEAETANRKATIEDSVLAAKSAIEEGCAPGGGYVFYHASRDIMKDKAFWKELTDDEKEGAMIVVKSLPIILKTVAENAGLNGDVVLNEVSRSKGEYVGFNAKTKKIENLVEAGVLDSAKVLRVCLENSISAASMILLIDCTIVDEPTECHCKDE